MQIYIFLDVENVHCYYIAIIIVKKIHGKNTTILSVDILCSYQWLINID